MSQVRKSGQHVMTGDHLQTLDRARHAMHPLKDDDQTAGVKWELTSTLQGLGDPNCLVEVVPGHLRFGLLRRGGVYQIVLNLKNSDVESTRFNVLVPKSDFVKCIYTPHNVAPGLSLQTIVELWAHHSGKIQQVVEVHCKGHVIKVPVTARVLDPEEYDSLDAESVLLNNKRILATCVRLQADSDLKLQQYYIAPNEFASLAETSREGDTPKVLRKVRIPKYKDPALEDDIDEETDAKKRAVMIAAREGLESGHSTEADNA